MAYVGSAGKSEGCIFCSARESDDVEAHILYRGDTIFVLLNAFPYNTGHLMVAPNRHVGQPEELNDDERHELMDVTTKAVAAIRSAIEPEGFNLGMNLGEIAGAGVPGHLHMHVVPRWAGDTNFMPVVGDTKVLPEMLTSTFAKLKPAFAD
jgi:ATP adenylyltransferase